MTSVRRQLSENMKPTTPAPWTKDRRNTLTLSGTESDTLVTSDVIRDVISPVSVTSKKAWCADVVQ